MPMFTEFYYRKLWGTVHRHDYCYSLAESIIQNHGRCRVLDIGTGCGYLVKRLRELGCDAWGLEISEYAIENTCAPGYVLRGSVLDIPFKDCRFDVVHSQGMWEYVAKEDIATGRAECWRVGAKQVHTVDPINSDIGEEDFVTRESIEWWAEMLAVPRILVACPTHECKAYAFDRWIENVKGLTYPNYEIFVVDNSETEEYAKRYSNIVPIVHLAVDQERPYHRITRSMEVIRQKFLQGNYAKWMNIEVDVIPPRNVIETMLRLGGDAEWISHAYPFRGEQANGMLQTQQGIGCSMLSRKAMEFEDFNEADDESPDAWLWARVKDRPNFRTMELWGYFDVAHVAV